MLQYFFTRSFATEVASVMRGCSQHGLTIGGLRNGSWSIFCKERYGKNWLKPAKFPQRCVYD